MIQEAIVLEWFTTVTTISSYYTINGSAPPLSCGRARPWSIRARLCFFVPTLYLSQNSTSTPLHPTPPSLPDNNNLRLRNSWPSPTQSLSHPVVVDTLACVHSFDGPGCDSDLCSLAASPARFLPCLRSSWRLHLSCPSLHSSTPPSKLVAMALSLPCS